MSNLRVNIGGEDRPMTEQEIALHQITIQGLQAQADAVAAKEVARQSGIDKLAALGLTVDEVSAVFGV